MIIGIHSKALHTLVAEVKWQNFEVVSINQQLSMNCPSLSLRKIVRDGWVTTVSCLFYREIKIIFDLSSKIITIESLINLIKFMLVWFMYRVPILLFLVKNEVLWWGVMRVDWSLIRRIMSMWLDWSDMEWSECVLLYLRNVLVQPHLITPVYLLLIILTSPPPSSLPTLISNITKYEQQIMSRVNKGHKMSLFTESW